MPFTAGDELPRSDMYSAAYTVSRLFLSLSHPLRFNTIHEHGTVPYACLSHDTILFNYTWCSGVGGRARHEPARPGLSGGGSAPHPVSSGLETGVGCTALPRQASLFRT